MTKCAQLLVKSDVSSLLRRTKLRVQQTFAFEKFTSYSPRERGFSAVRREVYNSTVSFF